MVVQIALSLVLLVAAGLFIRSLENARRLDPGFDADHVVLASLEISPATGYTRTEAALAFQQALLQSVQTLPGVEAATLADWVPLTLNVRTEEVTPDGYLPRERESMEVRRAFAGASYFETMRIALLAGRGIAPTDTRESEPVVVVNQAFGDRYWPGQQALGRTVRVRGRAHRVVGVTPNTAAFRPGEPPQPFFYMPMAQYWQWETILHVRVAGDPQAAAPEIVAAVHAQNPELPVFSVTTLRSTVRLATIFERVAATFVGAFGLVAIVLAAVGVYAVIAYAARQRTQEIAIRMALGASRREVAELVMRRGLLLTAAGVVLGLAGAAVVASLLQSRLFGVPALDPLTFCAVVLLLVTVALAACGIPARRALRIELSTALREG